LDRGKAKGRARKMLGKHASESVARRIIKGPEPRRTPAP
jgi:hypothetical protein